jgi:hypothetical protein
MKQAISVLISVSLCATTARAVEPPQVTEVQAKALVMASLTARQRRLPNLEVEPDPGPNSSKFLFFNVTWEGTPKGSVVVGNYAVDPHTGDVFSASAACDEEDNKRLRALQAQVRATLHLSRSEYEQLKTKGPLCDK